MIRGNGAARSVILAGILFLSVLITLGSCSEDTIFHIIEEDSSEPVIDLSQWSFTDDGPVRLFGNTWEFYWSRLYTPEAFKGGVYNPSTTSLIEPIFIAGGEAWNGLEVDGCKLPADGYATYRTIVKLPEAGLVYSFYMTNQDSAYRLWLDGELAASNGIVAARAEDYKPQRLPKLFHFQVQETELEIVMQIANYTHKWGGLTNNIFIGLPEQLQSYLVRQYLTAIFISGAILIMVFYHLFLFINRRKNVSSLLFSIFCFSILIWDLFSQDYLFFQVFPGFPLVPGLRLHLFMLFLASPSFVLFINSVFPGQLKRFTIWSVLITGSLICLTTVLTPVSFFTNIMLKAFYVTVMFHCVLIMFVLIRSILRKSVGAGFSTLGFLIFFATAIYDILANLKFIVGSPFGPFMPFSLFIFILIQSFLLAMKFSGAFKDLDLMTRSLDLKVRERSMQLAEVQRDMSEHEKLAAIGTMVGGISHEIMNPLSGITGPLSVLRQEIENSSLENKELLRKHLDYIELNSDDIYRAVKNLNALIKEQNIIKHPVKLREIAEKVISQYQNSDAEIIFESLTNKNDIISTDEGILFQILNNLVSNAAAATDASGKIQIIYSISETDAAVLSVSDNGCGMEDKVKSKAFDAFFTTCETKGGNGLGLYLVKRLTESLGWGVDIESEVGRGTRVKLNIND